MSRIPDFTHVAHGPILIVLPHPGEFRQGLAVGASYHTRLSHECAAVAVSLIEAPNRRLGDAPREVVE